MIHLPIIVNFNSIILILCENIIKSKPVELYKLNVYMIPGRLFEKQINKCMFSSFELEVVPYLHKNGFLFLFTFERNIFLSVILVTVFLLIIDQTAEFCLVQKENCHQNHIFLLNQKETEIPFPEQPNGQMALPTGKKIHPLFENLVPLGIMGDQLRALLYSKAL